MAFTSAAGYGNLPNGNFSPIILQQTGATCIPQVISR